MSKNSDVFTTTLRLNLKNPQDQEAWDNLMYADSSLPQYSSYTRTIVTAINDDICATAKGYEYLAGIRLRKAAAA